jgi:hypothetical protein
MTSVRKRRETIIRSIRGRIAISASLGMLEACTRPDGRNSARRNFERLTGEDNYIAVFNSEFLGVSSKLHHRGVAQSTRAQQWDDSEVSSQLQQEWDDRLALLKAPDARERLLAAFDYFPRNPLGLDT